MVDVVPSFLCVHQGYELYGSDRVFIQSLKALRQQWPNARITVHLPQNGPIVDALENLASELIIGKLWVYRRSRCRWRHVRGLLNIPSEILTAWHFSKTHDIVYLNTLMNMSYNLIAPFIKKPLFIHVHELPVGSKKHLAKLLLRWMQAIVIFNSSATKKAFNPLFGHVVRNGILDLFIERTPQKTTPLKLLLIGRMNHLKGQLLAVQAIEKLVSLGLPSTVLRLVGGGFEDQTHYEDDIKQAILKARLSSKVAIFPFIHDPTPHYQWAHLVLVPSTEPESFSLVTLEAMMHGVPVIAAKHGGPVEIVQEGVTGRFHIPNDSDDLAEAIRTYIVHSELVHSHGKMAREVFVENWQENRYIKDFLGVITSHALSVSDQTST